MVDTDGREGDGSADDNSLGWTRTGVFCLGNYLKGNLADSGSEVEADCTDRGETPIWSTDPEILQEEARWYARYRR